MELHELGEREVADDIGVEHEEGLVVGGEDRLGQLDGPGGPQGLVLGGGGGGQFFIDAFQNFT